MTETSKIIFKFWFKNGTYIEKEVIFDESTSQEDVENFEAILFKLKNTIKEVFKDDLNGNIKINNMIVRCSELIAFDIIQIVEEQENADLRDGKVNVKQEERERESNE